VGGRARTIRHGADGGVLCPSRSAAGGCRFSHSSESRQTPEQAPHTDAAEFPAPLRWLLTAAAEIAESFPKEFSVLAQIFFSKMEGAP